MRAPVARTEVRSGDRLRRLALVAAVAIVALSFLLRVYRLGFQSLTGDEAFSMLAAERWLAGEMDLYGSGGIEPTPPLHFLLLHFWSRLAGFSEFSGRYLSLAAGVLVVPVSFVLGRRLSGNGLGLALAVIAATNPFLILQSQTARFYSLTACLALFSTWFLIRLLDSFSRVGEGDVSQSRARPFASLWLLAGYVVTTLLVLYTHSMAALLLVAHWALYVLWPSSRAHFRSWIVGQLIILLVYLPWGIRAVSLLAAPFSVWSERGTIPEILWRLFTSFALGGAANLPLTFGSASLAAGGRGATVLVASGVAIFAIGVAGLAFRGRQKPSLVAIAWFAIPLLIAVLLAVKTVLIRDRYLIPFLPGYLLGIAAGVALIGSRRRVLGLAALAVAILPAAVALPLYYRTTVFVSSQQVAALTSYVDQTALTDSAIVVNLPASDPFFQYYRLPRPTSWVSDAQPSDRGAGLPALAKLAANHSEIWLLPFGYGDASNHFVEAYLGSEGFKTEDRWFGNLRLIRYTLSKGSGARQALQAGPASFAYSGGNVTISEYMIDPPRPRPGDVLALTLYWRPEGPLPARYKVFVHIDDASGKTRAQQDSEPVGGQRPTDGWRAGETIADRFGLALPTDLPEGEYRVDVGLYAVDGGQRLSLPNGDNHAVIATVRVAR